mgnify:CR=1 FL=1
MAKACLWKDQTFMSAAFMVAFFGVRYRGNMTSGASTCTLLLRRQKRQEGAAAQAGGSTKAINDDSLPTQATALFSTQNTKGE